MLQCGDRRPNGSPPSKQIEGTDRSLRENDVTLTRTTMMVMMLALMTSPRLDAVPAARLPQEAREELAAFARKVLSGEVTAVSPVEMLKMHASLRQPLPEQLFVTVFRDRAPGIRFTAEKFGLVEATFAAMGKARTLPSFGFYHYDDAANVTLLFERVVDRQTIPPPRWVADLAFLELGVDGLAIVQPAWTEVNTNTGRATVHAARDGALPPGEAFVSGLSTRDEFINRLSGMLRVYYKLPRITAPDMVLWNPTRTRVEMLRFETFLSRGAGYPVVDLYRMNDLAVAPWTDPLAAARRLGDALVRRQLPDGRFFTRYDARYARFVYLYPDVVDHAIACLTLSDLAAVSGEPQRASYLAAAAKGIAWVKTFLRSQKTAKDEPFLFVVQDEEAKLGAAAALVLALDRYASLTGSVFHDGDMKLLGKFLLTQQDDDGSFRHYYRWDPKAPFRYRLTHSFPGQAAWALSVLEKRFGGKEWGAAARKAADYLVTKRDAEMQWTETPSDPWLTWALRELSTPFAEERYLVYARKMADQTLKRQKTSGAPDLAGSFEDDSGASASSAALGATLLGATASFTAPPDPTRAAQVEAMRRAVRFLRLNEVRSNNAFYLPNPERGYGLVRSGVFDSDARLDTTCHVIEALLWMDRVEKMK
jgi:hypothetical protein